MPIRGEREQQQASPMAPLMVGCALLMVLLIGAAGAGVAWLSRRTDAYTRAAPVLTPIPPPTPMPVPVSAPEPDPIPAADVPTIVAPGSEVSGTLSQEVIAHVVRTHLSQVRQCYEAELRADPGLTARVVAHFTIDATGAVSAATVDGSSNVALTTCIASHVRTWMFPAPNGGGIVTVNYPFVLSAS